MFKKRKKKRYLAVFLIKEQNTYSIIGKKVFNPLKPSLEYSGNTYIINSETPTFTKGLFLFFYIDTDEKKQLLFVKKNKNEKQVDTEIVDLIMSKKIIKQLTSDLGNTDFTTIILYLIIGGAIGGLLGYIIGGG